MHNITYITVGMVCFLLSNFGNFVFSYPLQNILVLFIYGTISSLNKQENIPLPALLLSVLRMLPVTNTLFLM